MSGRAALCTTCIHLSKPFVVASRRKNVDARSAHTTWLRPNAIVIPYPPFRHEEPTDHRDVCFGRLLLGALLNLTRRMFEGGAHVAVVGLGIEVALLEVPLLPSNAFGAWQWNRPAGRKALPSEAVILGILLSSSYNKLSGKWVSWRMMQALM